MYVDQALQNLTKKSPHFCLVLGQISCDKVAKCLRIRQLNH